MTDRPIYNCYWVIPGQFLAGEYPRDSADSSSQAKIDALIRAGVTAFIDLTEADEGLLPYSQLLSAYSSRDVSHERFPIRDVSIPSSGEKTTVILDAIDRHIQQGRMVYVHCWGGVGRTGVIVGCWLARHGYPGEAALSKLRQLWQQCPKSAFRASPETAQQEQYIITWQNAG